MNIDVRVVRRATNKAVQVILAEHPYRIAWYPRSAIIGGEFILAGARDIVMDVAEWLVQAKEDEFAELLEA